MNIIKRELKAHLKSLIIWSLCICFLIIGAMSEFSAYYNNPEMADILESMPEAILQMFSMQGANLTTVSGYISLLSIFFYLILGIHAVLLGSSILSKEERDKTAEFLFTLPIARNKVVFGKLTAAVINCLVLLFVTASVVLISISSYEADKGFSGFFILCLVSLFIVQIIFLSIGMLTASMLKRYKRSGSVSVFILLGTYIISVLIGFSEDLTFLKYITPFKYFVPVDILNTNRFELIFIIISICIIAACLCSTFIFYKRRDLHI